MAIKGTIKPEELGQSKNSNNLYLNDLKDLSELKFRIIGDAISGYQYFQNAKRDDGTDTMKPVRSEDYPETLENPATQPWNGETSKPVQFLAMAIYDFADETIKLFQVTKKALLKSLAEVEFDDDLGEIQDYEFKAKKTGVKMDTEYTLLRLDKTEATKEMLELYEKANVNLDDYMACTGGIGEKKGTEIDLSSDDVDPSKIDF